MIWPYIVLTVLVTISIVVSFYNDGERVRMSWLDGIIGVSLWCFVVWAVKIYG